MVLIMNERSQKAVDLSAQVPLKIKEVALVRKLQSRLGNVTRTHDFLHVIKLRLPNAK